jgi:hypothetical protein
MKRYIKSFLPNFRPLRGPDASFELQDFADKDFKCPIVSGDMGVYVITSTRGIRYTYPNGKKSPIIYIGMSDDLLRRLKDEHYTKGLKRLINDKDWGLKNNWQLPSKYQYMYYNGSHVDVFKCRGKQESKDLESIFLNQFYQKYRALPIGNGARSYGKE